MATIESRPLPPPGFGATTITEADRAKIMAQANEIIDFYLNGPGSFTPDGPRKPPVDEPGFDSTVQDLNGFKESVTIAKQFADDPNHILDSVIDLVKKTVGQIQNTVRDQATTGPDVKDNISRRPLPIIDPLNNARVPAPDPETYISQDPGNAFPRRVLSNHLTGSKPSANCWLQFLTISYGASSNAVNAWLHIP